MLSHSGFSGATDPIRTDDLLITSELLYLLSHGSILTGSYYNKALPFRQEVFGFFRDFLRKRSCKILFYAFVLIMFYTL